MEPDKIKLEFIPTANESLKQIKMLKKRIHQRKVQIIKEAFLPYADKHLILDFIELMALGFAYGVQRYFLSQLEKTFLSRIRAYYGSLFDNFLPYMIKTNSIMTGSLLYKIFQVDEDSLKYETIREVSKIEIISTPENSKKLLNLIYQEYFPKYYPDVKIELNPEPKDNRIFVDIDESDHSTKAYLEIHEIVQQTSLKSFMGEMSSTMDRFLFSFRDSKLYLPDIELLVKRIAIDFGKGEDKTFYKRNFYFQISGDLEKLYCFNPKFSFDVLECKNEYLEDSIHTSNLSIDVMNNPDVKNLILEKFRQQKRKKKPLTKW